MKNITAKAVRILIATAFLVLGAVEFYLLFAAGMKFDMYLLHFASFDVARVVFYIIVPVIGIITFRVWRYTRRLYKLVVRACGV